MFTYIDNVISILFAIEHEILRTKLLQLSQQVTKPTKPFINLQAIYDGINNLPAKHIKQEVQEVCKQGFLFKTDRKQWHKLSLNKHITKSTRDEPHKIEKQVEYIVIIHIKHEFISFYL